jgi:DNA-binding beta-propeller fold protein YncE
MHEGLVVALGRRRFRVERPWGDLPDVPGHVTDVAVNSQGRVFVLLQSDSLLGQTGPAVVVLAPDGTRVSTWGSGLIADAHMLEVAPDDSVYLVDRDGHQVVRCTRDGELLGVLGGRNAASEPFNHPCDVAFGPNGHVYVADGYGNSLVHQFTQDGLHIKSFGKRGLMPAEFLCPHGLWAMPDGRIVVADRDNNRLQRFSEDGELINVITGFVKPMSVWGCGNENYVTDQGPTLCLLSDDGTIVGCCRPVLKGAHGVAGDPGRRTLYLAEDAPSRVTRLVEL